MLELIAWAIILYVMLPYILIALEVCAKGVGMACSILLSPLKLLTHVAENVAANVIRPAIDQHFPWVAIPSALIAVGLIASAFVLPLSWGLWFPAMLSVGWLGGVCARRALLNDFKGSRVKWEPEAVAEHAWWKAQEQSK